MLPSDSFKRRGTVSALEPDQSRIWDRGGEDTLYNRNVQLYTMLSSAEYNDRLRALMSTVNASDDITGEDNDTGTESKMEL